MLGRTSSTVKRRGPKSVAEGGHHLCIGALRQQFNWRHASSPCRVKCESNEHHGDDYVRPRIQRPLPGPGELDAVDRPQILNGSLLAVWPARTDEVT
jgi:hypothetical protein